MRRNKLGTGVRSLDGVSRADSMGDKDRLAGDKRADEVTESRAHDTLDFGAHGSRAEAGVEVIKNSVVNGAVLVGFSYSFRTRVRGLVNAYPWPLGMEP